MHVAGYFWSLNERRSGGGFGSNPIPPSEIEAWARLHGIVLRPWEVRALDRMERVHLGLLNKPDDEPEQTDVVSVRPLSTDLFDALF